jgi:hypothetical protein
MATVHAYDKRRESMLVSYISAPILAFGAMTQWNKRKTLSFVDVDHNCVASKGLWGRFRQWFCWLKSHGCPERLVELQTVSVFLKQLLNGNKGYQENDTCHDSCKLNFNDFIQWFDALLAYCHETNTAKIY